MNYETWKKPIIFFKLYSKFNLNTKIRQYQCKYRLFLKVLVMFQLNKEAKSAFPELVKEFRSNITYW